MLNFYIQKKKFQLELNVTKVKKLIKYPIDTYKYIHNGNNIDENVLAHNKLTIKINNKNIISSYITHIS